MNVICHKDSFVFMISFETTFYTRRKLIFAFLSVNRENSKRKNQKSSQKVMHQWSWRLFPKRINMTKQQVVWFSVICQYSLVSKSPDTTHHKISCAPKIGSHTKEPRHFIIKDGRQNPGLVLPLHYLHYCYPKMLYHHLKTLQL